MIEILIDTETTGLSRETEFIVEIGCVEVRNLVPTGREFHCFIKPPKSMPYAAQRIHGITDAMLKDKPPFKDVARQFLDFIGDHPIVAHNARFDQGFLDAELGRLGLPPLSNPIVDTMEISKQVRKGKGSHKLDAICRDYGISLAKRTKHGALLDAQILAEAYVELRGGRQRALDVVVDETPSSPAGLDCLYRTLNQIRYRPRITPLEAIDHYHFVREQVANPIWADYFD